MNIKISFKDRIKEAFRRRGCKPFVQPLAFSSSDRILVVAPHPDDEAIGCGALMEKYHGLIDVLLVTNGAKGNPEWTKDNTIRVRHEEFLVATSRVATRYELFLEDTEFSYREFKRKKFDFSRYNAVFVPNVHESHPDHVKTNLFISHILSGLKQNIRIFEYEVWTPLRNVNCYVDFKNKVEEKKELIGCYESQIKHIDYGRKRCELNSYRGMQLSVGYAECYYLQVDLIGKFFELLYDLYKYGCWYLRM